MNLYYSTESYTYGKENNIQIIYYYYLFSMYSNIKIDSQNEVWQQYHMQVVRRTQVDMTQADPVWPRAPPARLRGQPSQSWRTRRGTKGVKGSQKAMGQSTGFPLRWNRYSWMKKGLHGRSWTVLVVVFASGHRWTWLLHRVCFDVRMIPDRVIR